MVLAQDFNRTSTGLDPQSGFKRSNEKNHFQRGNERNHCFQNMFLFSNPELFFLEAPSTIMLTNPREKNS